MKICFITHSIFSLGGVQRVLSVVASKLAENHTVDILCTSDESNLDKSIYNISSKIKINYILDTIGKIGKEPLYCKFGRGVNKNTNIFNRRCFVPFLSKIYFTKGFEEQIIQYINSKDYDIVIGVEGRNSILLGKISDKIKAKTIGWQHNSFDAYFRTPQKYLWHQDEMYKKYAVRLDGYVVLTDSDKKNIKEQFKLNAVRIYNPLSFTSNKKSECKNKKIISVGRLTEQKGFDLLIKAFSYIANENKEWSLEIIGDGTDKIKLEELISKLNLSEQVNIRPFTNNIQECYIDSSIFVSSSRWEGFGLVITEAMECGLPIIAFDNSGPKEIINEHNGILVPCGNEKKLADSINELIKDKDKLKKLSTESIIRASDFKIDNIIRQWEQLFNNIH